MNAFDIALRFQHLASGWLIYAYNNDAGHDPAFIDDSAWPITLHEFDEEHRSVAATLAGLGGAVAPARPGVPRDFRLPGVSLAIVTICDYPPDTPLLRLATSVHRIYAARHGYDYVLREEASAGGRPPAWGKVRAVQELLEDGRWDWVLWADCDLYFMDLGTTLDSLLARYGSGAGGGLDPRVQLLLTEDEQTLNTAIFLLRRSAWSLELLRRVWGPEDSPFANHTWWEQAAFAQELLGANHRRLAGVAYGPRGASGGGAGEVAGPRAYPPEVRVVPQAEMNSYHPISSRLVGETWAPGRFVLSFNGAQSLSGPAAARVLHANYYEVFCRLNALGGACEALDRALLAPWLAEGAA